MTAYSIVGDNNSRTIELLRFPLAVLVVCIHTYIEFDGYDYSSISNNSTFVNILVLFETFLRSGIAQVAVPAFFFISGYLFFSKLEKEWDFTEWKRKIKGRNKTLFVPYIIWNLIFILIFLLSFLGKNGFSIENITTWILENNGIRMLWDSIVWNNDKVDWLGTSAISTAPYLVPLWYVRDLMVLVVISPVIFLLIKERIIRYIYLALVLFFYITSTTIPIHGLTFFSLFFFSIGGVFKLESWNLDISKNWGGAFLPDSSLCHISGS